MSISDIRSIFRKKWDIRKLLLNYFPNITLKLLTDKELINLEGEIINLLERKGYWFDSFKDVIEWIKDEMLTSGELDDIDYIFKDEDFIEILKDLSNSGEYDFVIFDSLISDTPFYLVIPHKCKEFKEKLRKIVEKYTKG